MEDVRYHSSGNLLKLFNINTLSLQERHTGFTSALAVLITGASQSRQHGKSKLVEVSAAQELQRKYTKCLLLLVEVTVSTKLLLLRKVKTAQRNTLSEKEDNVNNTNNVNVDGTNGVNVVGELPSDPGMPALEDIGTFDFSNEDEDDDAMADMNNLDTTIQVFRNKKDERGIMIRNKARLVAQGHTQEEGINYDEDFSHIARIKAIRLFLAYASFKDFVVYQIDVKSAFLYGKIKEEVYVCQPPGFEDPDFPNRVYKVKKALYGLHQATRACQEYDTPMETQKPLLKDEDGEEVDVHIYRYQVNPKVLHLHGVKRIFRYLKGQPKLGLWYPKDSSFDLVVYTDSDYAGASLDRKSTTKGCQYLGSRLISWQCKK
nr:retrovirus-related Pol polyprotein from transposon TNT 1-94 [Tanacetum cinerariifolium]